MRDMIFNDLSVQIPVDSIHEVRPLLVDITKGMACLVSAGAAKPILRMTRGWDEYRCARDGSLWDLISLMRRDRMEPDETRFLMRLGMKAPLLDDLPDDVVDRFRGCEPIIGVDSGGECLVLCAHLLGVAISLRLQPEVDCDRLLVRFREMTAQLQIEDVEETIDNLARETHAAVILARHRRQLVGNLSFSNLWSKRAAAFPHLRFGLDVEANLQCLNPALVGPVVKRLDELNEAAEEWPRIATPAPRWRSKVSPESERVMKNALLKSFRVFKSADGQSTLFEWHARFGSSHRIHLRFDREVFAVEIGYIGLHLPLA